MAVIWQSHIFLPVPVNYSLLCSGLGLVWLWDLVRFGQFAGCLTRDEPFFSSVWGLCFRGLPFWQGLSSPVSPALFLGFKGQLSRSVAWFRFVLGSDRVWSLLLELFGSGWWSVSYFTGFDLLPFFSGFGVTEFEVVQLLVST